MLDEDLKRVAEAAVPVWLEDHQNTPGDVQRYVENRRQLPAAQEAFRTTFDPPTVLSLLSRLSAAAERERDLVEALRPFAEAVKYHIGEGESSAETFRHAASWGSHKVTVGDFRNAARALQAKDPTP